MPKPDPDGSENWARVGLGLCVYTHTLPDARGTFLLHDHKHFKTCTYSLGIKSLHPSANKFPAPVLHMHWKGKRNVEHGPEGRAPGTQDLMHGASAQELLAQCLSRSLLLEKEESKRFEDQLQQWLSADTGVFTDSTSLPLYLPQTLVSLPQALKPVMKTVTTTSPQNERTREQLQLSETTGTSVTERLKHLERLMQSSREEEVASELHLSALLDMVDI